MTKKNGYQSENFYSVRRRMEMKGEKSLKRKF